MVKSAETIFDWPTLECYGNGARLGRAVSAVSALTGVW